ncbi:PH domain-containing protein [Sphingobacterium sp. SRCM116780]|uniref:PH domain-containing protein n=1 Tax=Sphingobacterium sp. SRCM116780 TaxID=2907623 RepID=UPI001F3971BE|nr:PH domain-containing protein [Sphingobacterium sp. SRCM116780]UIR56056.1 PH domain-containing protein [Sphingobacterium sp. SRCM116780]
MKIFKSKRDLLMDLLTIVPIILVVVMILVFLVQDSAISSQDLLVLGLSIILIALLLFPRPKYIIEGDYFRYRAGIFRGKIAIANMHKIEVGKTLWVGFKPATARKGLIIHYKKYKEIYISPSSNEEFVKELLKLNPAIVLITT